MPAGGRGEPVVLRGPRRMDLLRDETLPGLFAATAARGPERPALIWGERVVSYGELHAASNTIAAALNRRGTTAGKVVGLLLPRGADLLIAQLGITKSGAAWLPFDSETPIARVQTCLQSAGASGLVACRACLPRLDGISSPVWTVEDLLAEPAPALLPPSPQPRDPAYVIYTSGSTGAPKGIVISHRSICHFLRSENELLGVREDDRVYQGFSVAFDMSFEEIWISYLVGATLWIAPPSVIADPDALAEAVQKALKTLSESKKDGGTMECRKCGNKEKFQALVTDYRPTEIWVFGASGLEKRFSQAGTEDLEIKVTCLKCDSKDVDTQGFSLESYGDKAMESVSEEKWDEIVG